MLSRKEVILILIGVVGVIGISFLVFKTYQLWKAYVYAPPREEIVQSEAVHLKIEEVISGLSNPWDMEITESGDIYFTQRGSGLYRYSNGGILREIYKPDNLYVLREGGMLGLALSPQFSKDQTLIVCYNRLIPPSRLEVVVEKVKLAGNGADIADRSQLVGGIPANLTGRHSGCRLIFDSEGYLWITTGDAAQASNPQDLNSLGGKILRVDRNGNPHPKNPFLSDPDADSRIFSYGHRNTQGVFLFDQYSELYGYGFTTEHGPNINDEINPLLPGNFGWDPGSGYDESVPMTDTEKYPDSILPVWTSGSRTIAISEIVRLDGEQWGEWEGSYLVAALKDQYILRMELQDGKFELIEQVVNDRGRIRDLYVGPDGAVYFSTDNGRGEDIVGRLVVIQL